MNDTTKPDLSGLEPVAWLNKKIPHMAVLTKPDDGGGWFPVVLAATVERLVQERGANAAYFEAYHHLRVAVNAAYPQDPYQLAEDVPALMQQQLAAMTQERDNVKSLAIYYREQLTASQSREQQLREALEFCREKFYITRGTRVPIIEEALALPQDDTALKAWGAKLLREWVAKIMSHGCTWAVTNMNLKADELERRENRNG